MGGVAGELRPVPALAELYAVEHLLRQEEIAERVSAGLKLLWPILLLVDLAQSTPAWLHAVTLQIKLGWDESAQEAFEYTQRALWCVEPDAPVLDKVDVPFPAEAVQTSMRVTGPVEVKRQIGRAVPEQDAMSAARERSTGVGATKATDGGRSQVIAQVEELAANPVRDRQYAELQRYRGELADLEARGAAVGRQGKLRELIENVERTLGGYVPAEPVEPAESPKASNSGKAKSGSPKAVKRERGVIGYARMTDSNPCYFCALLASQGAVYYGSDSFDQSNRKFKGAGVAKVHDNCQCTMRPVFRKSDAMDARAKYFLAQWNKFGRGGDGRSAEQNFRRNYVPPPPYDSVASLSQGDRLDALDAARKNRELLLARGFGAGSPNVRFWDDSISKLEVF